MPRLTTIREARDGLVVIERMLEMANAELKRIARALDRLEAAEAKEDADAEAFRVEKEAKVADLQAQIAALEATPKLDEEGQADLAALVARLEAMSPPPAEPDPLPGDGGIDATPDEGQGEGDPPPPPTEIEE